MVDSSNRITQEASWPPAIERLAPLDFRDVSFDRQRMIYDVPYVELEDVCGGRMWVTRHGWRHLQKLDPAHWYVGDQYSQRGDLLSAGTGAVFRVSTADRQRRAIDLVVKFSRVAQRVDLHVAPEFPGDLPTEAVDNAAFNDPFQEFGLLEEMRGSRFGPPSVQILTKRPLAIYAPGKQFESWQLGRAEDVFYRHRYRLENDQAMRGSDSCVEFSIQRQYVLLFHWVRGTDAETLLRQGKISKGEATTLVRMVVEDLAAKGFRVLDTKLNHIILRHHPDRGLLCRRNRPVYALVDFELLQRTETYQRWQADAERDARRVSGANWGLMPSSRGTDVSEVSAAS